MKNDDSKILSAVFESKEDTQGIFARIPLSLYQKVLEVKRITKKSIYEIVETGLRLVTKEHEKRQIDSKIRPSDSKLKGRG
jgi:hypothetical protein